jgi:hypothetical protein
MSNKSGVSNQIISLPQGGGALHGIGEKFAPDLHTGTGNFTVPAAFLAALEKRDAEYETVSTMKKSKTSCSSSPTRPRHHPGRRNAMGFP